MANLLTKLFGSANDRTLKRIWPVVRRIGELEAEYEALPAEAFPEKTAEFRQRLADGETLDEILPEAFAVVREASKRTTGLRHFDVQFIGGIVLHQGTIAEMKTGEGKTLVATLPLYLNALEGKGAHLVTVNDYLARRDVQWMGPIYQLLGLTVASIVHDTSFLFDPTLHREGLPHAQPAADRAQGRLPRRHHLRHQPRVRLRLPARQHEVQRSRSTSSASSTSPSSTRSTTS